MANTDLGSIVAHLKLEMEDFKSKLNKAQEELQKTDDSFKGFEASGKALSSVGGAITAGVTVPLMAVGASVVKTQAQFQDAMAKVQALSGATGSDLQLLEDTAKKMGAETVFSATEAADALGYMALAGWDAKQSAEGLPGVLNLAASSGMGLAEASDLVTDYLSAFGEEANQAGRMADVLAYAQSNSNTTTEMLGEAFKNCAVNANAFGMDIEQTTAVLGKLADQGLKGSEAGTALNAVFRDMSSKMKDGAIQIGNTSVKITDANGNFKTMADIVSGVTKATDGMSESERMVALQSTFTTDSIKAMGILCNTSGEAINAFTNELYNSEGTAKKTADTMNNTLRGALDELSSAWEGVQLNIGDTTGILTSFIKKITELVRWFDGLSDGTKQVIMVILGFTAALGPAMLIVGKFIQGINNMRKGWGMLKALWGVISGPVLSALSTAMTAIYVFIMDSLIPGLTALWGVLMANPIILIITAIIALVGAFIYLWNNCEGFKQFWINLWEIVKTAAMNAWNAVIAFFTQTMPQWFNSIIDWFKKLPSTIWYWLVFCISYVVLWAGQMIQKGMQAGRDFVNAVINWIKQLPGKIWTWLVNTYNRVVQWAQNMWNKATQTGSQFVNNVIQWIQTLPGRIWSWLLDAIHRVTQWVGDMKDKASEAADGFVQNITDGLSGLPGKLWNMGADMVRGLIDGIQSKATDLWNACVNLANDAVNAAKKHLKINSPSKVFRDKIGKYIPEGITVGIKTNAKGTLKAITDFSSALVRQVNATDFLHDVNIGTSGINISNDSTMYNGGVIQAIRELKQTIADSKEPLDYDRMSQAFKDGAERVSSMIVMDETLVGEKTATTVKSVNEFRSEQQERFRGDKDYV